MSTALEAASLVMVPSGYEDGTLASVKPTDGTGDFTFSRGSDISATRVNANGYIEKGYENLLLQSNSFTTTWQLASLNTPISGQSGYDNTNDAWLIESQTAFGQLYQNIPASGVVSFSIYAKSGTCTSVLLTINGNISGSGNFFLTGDGNSTSTPSAVTSKIQRVGTSDWYRCTITHNDSNITRVRVIPSDDNGSPTAGTLYIQDAMINQGLVAYPYIETTAAPVAGGILEDMPRLDYSNGSCPALLLEPQRTNLLPYSEYFDTYTRGAITIDYNSTLSPEGVVNAARIIENTATSEHNLLIAPLSTANGTASFYYKPNGRTKFSVSLTYSTGAGEVYYDTSALSANISGTGVTSASIEASGNGWYKIIQTMPNVVVLRFRLNSDTGLISYQGDGTSGGYIYGLQVEQDATYPTSYIPTYGVSQTRLDEGTSVLTLPETLTDNYTLFFDFKELIAANRWVRFLSSTNSFVYVFYSYGGHYDVYNGSSFIVDTSADPDGKIALKQSGSSVKIFVNGADKTKAGATANLTDIAKFQFDFKPSNNSGILNQMLVFNTALTDSECIELTTI